MIRQKYGGTPCRFAGWRWNFCDLDGQVLVVLQPERLWYFSSISNSLVTVRRVWWADEGGIWDCITTTESHWWACQFGWMDASEFSPFYSLRVHPVLRDVMLPRAKLRQVVDSLARFEAIILQYLQYTINDPRQVKVALERILEMPEDRSIRPNYEIHGFPWGWNWMGDLYREKTRRTSTQYVSQFLLQGLPLIARQGLELFGSLSWMYNCYKNPAVREFLWC